MPDFVERVVDAALRGMNNGPRSLDRALQFYATDEGGEFSEATLCDFLEDGDPNASASMLLRRMIARWDTQADGDWIGETQPRTLERRIQLYTALACEDRLRTLCDRLFPVFEGEDRTIVITRDYERWYTDERRRSSFYWEAYSRYLEERGGWSHESLTELDQSTSSIVERLSDPTRPDIYSSRGLVVGHVQSGKTANFTGVIAKAADAGYRLIIVLAGTMDILRSQTQRRIDRELIGREILEDQYLGDTEWPHDFVSHGGFPSELGAFDWERLTLRLDDYKLLRQGILALEFPKRNRTLPFFHPANLHPAAAKLIVIKKNPKILGKLTTDLVRIRALLEEIPTLVIDDESDQASPNTLRQGNDAGARRRRTATNRAIVRLLEQLPRAQYVGYTATPFANVFIDPDDAEDLFPRDFILSLRRPAGYMGAADFHDLDLPAPDGYDSNERAFVRSVRVTDDAIAENLPRALDSFVLAGAIKLYRLALNPALVKRFRHHTMLVHISVRNDDQGIVAEEVRRILGERDYDGGDGWRALEQLWEEDFAPVCAARHQGYSVPASFADLRSHIGECLRRIDLPQAVLVVNGLVGDSPDFDTNPVWKILVGGAKLSRGYTVEGLTTSYYRRRAATADTLMQMGRWFGFRGGYSDLVRLFIGRNEPPERRPLDLYAAFEGACRDEIDFRSQLSQYAMRDDGQPLRPEQVPPLVPAHLLRPTANNKMFNAVIASRNFGSQSIERTQAPTDGIDIELNQNLVADLLTQSSTEIARRNLRIRLSTGANYEYTAWASTSTPDQMIDFLTRFHWQVGHVLEDVIKFLRGDHGNPEIGRWVVLLLEGSQLPAFTLTPVGGPVIPLPVFRRSRINTANSDRFGVYSESRHRHAVEYLSGIGATDARPNPELQALFVPRQAVLMVYPIREVGHGDDGLVTMGLRLTMPQNSIRSPIAFTVRDQNRRDQVVIEGDAG
jgi:hypothetical protein